MKSFPNVIPVFPLSGVIYFPKTNLPLNIFEQRYLDLVNDTYKNDKTSWEWFNLIEMEIKYIKLDA